LQIQKLWQVAWDLWEHWNGILHNQSNIVTEEEVSKLNQTVQNLYFDNRQCLLQQDRYLTSLPLQMLMSKDTHYKRTWISQIKETIKAQRHQNWAERQRQETEISSMRRRMQNWLQNIRLKKYNI
jgi:hypothetical protein